MRIPLFILSSLWLTLARLSADPASAGTIAWQPWSESVFQQAAREHKFVLLDLEAVWCHWCHVMDGETYSDPQVIALINAHYIAVRVDQDSRPDLANRYENYGWPATVVFNADHLEIVKRQGYLPPKEMASMLRAIIADPSPGPSVTNAGSPRLTGDVFQGAPGWRDLARQLDAGYDGRLGGWSTAHKFLDWDNTEYEMVQSQDGDAQAAARACQTLDAQLKLIDPVWGGVDQYSIDDWDHPHFEKLIQMQAEDMRIYALAYAQWKDPAYLKAAQKIYGYVRAFLTSPDGVVYTSQDADLHPGEAPEPYYKLDDAGRRKLGLPRVDKAIYARENGWFIQALVGLYSATGDVRYREEAVRAADWIVRHRSVAGGGFSHGAEASPLYLGDTLAMGCALLDLAAATGDTAYLGEAETAVAFIGRNFAYSEGGTAVGFATAARGSSPEALRPGPEFDENVTLARLANLLFHYTNNPADRAIAQTALRYAAAPDVAHARGPYVGGLLLARMERAEDPIHVVILGPKSDPAARKLLLAALAIPRTYKQIEWLDPAVPSSELALYPRLDKAAAFVCAHQSCSAPIYDTLHLEKFLSPEVRDRKEQNLLIQTAK